MDLVGWWRIPRPRRRSDARAENQSGSEIGDCNDDKGAGESAAGPITRPIRVIVQCRAIRKGPRPSDVRELESTVGSAAGFAFAGMETYEEWGGAVASVPAEDIEGKRYQEIEDEERDSQTENHHTRGESMQDEDVLGLLVSTGDATRGVRDALGRSRWPVGFLKVSSSFGAGEVVSLSSSSSSNIDEREDEADNADDDNDDDHTNDGNNDNNDENRDDLVNADAALGRKCTEPVATIEQFIWNYVATGKWLTGLGVTVRYVDSPSSQTASRHEDNPSSPGNEDAHGSVYTGDTSDFDTSDSSETTSTLRREIGLTWKGEVLPSACACDV